MPAPEISLKQQAIVPLVAAGMLNRSEIARTLGIDRQTVSKALQDPAIQSQIEKARKATRKGQLDNARTLAKKALGLAHIAVDGQHSDAVEQVQVAAGAITVAAKHEESFGSENEQQITSESRADAMRYAAKLQYIAAKVALRYGATALEAYRRKCQR